MLTWHYVTSAAYNSAEASAKTADKLFFLSDTHEIYRGTENFTESVILVSELPTTPAVGKLYIDSTTLEGKIYNGKTWTTVIQPVQASLTKTDTDKPVSGKAVADYVATEIEKVTGSDGLVAGVEVDATTRGLKVTKADGTSEVLKDIVVDLAYDTKTGKLQVKDANGTAVGTGVNLDLERFVQSASYADGKITLVFNDNTDPIEINVGDLVDTYTAKSSKTINLTVTDNEFTAEAIVATTKGNILKATDAGLFVAATDISGKIDKVASATADDIATLTADGSVKDSGLKAGGATLATTTNAKTLATEAAVAAVRTALTDSINGKMAKVGTGKTGQIITANASGDAAASGKTIGGKALATAPTANVVATELAVKTYVDGYAVAKTSVVADGSVAETVAAASDGKVASEKAFVNAMTWKTTV